MRNRSLHSRRGVSLIEMVLVIGCLTTLVSICGTFLVMLMRLERGGRDAVASSIALGRLARQFRDDVRGAREASIPTDPSQGAGIDLRRPDGGLTSYRFSRGAVDRSEGDAGKVRRRERYEIGTGGRARVDVEGSRVVLELSGTARQPTSPLHREIHIEGTLARGLGPASRRSR